MKIKIGKKYIGEGQPCFIIAEAGSNHNHDLRLAKKLIDVAVEAGADAVKFQSLKFDELYSPNLLPNKKTKRLFPKIELPESWYPELAQYASSRKILFLSSATYFRAVDLLEKIRVKAYKIASPQAVGHLPLVSYIAKKKKPIFLSTGYATYSGIKRAVDVCLKEKNKKIVILHCISKYPTLPSEANLEAIPYLKKKFKLPVGFSDHTLGYHITLAAVVKGANVIEKHFTLSRKLKGPDHFYALEPGELKEMITKIREIEQSFGSGQRNYISKEEKKLIPQIQTRLITARSIKAGEILKESMFEYKRAPYGVFASELNKVLGFTVIRFLAKGSPLVWGSIGGKLKGRSNN